jgi:hypothetical protein
MLVADAVAAQEMEALASTYLAPPSSAMAADASGENANIYYSASGLLRLDDNISTKA